MKKAFDIIGLALALLLAFSSCQKAPFLTFSGQKSFTFKDAGGSETVTFSCNRAWTVTSSESWLTASPAKGDANEEGVRVTITCVANTTYDPRNATVTISSEGMTEVISISQDTNYGLISDPTTFNLTNAAQNIEVEVKANVEYTVTIDDACKDWISQAGTKALSSTKLTFSIAANESYDDREGKITISQKGSSTSVQPQVITVKQSQINGLFITTPEYELSNESHDLTVEVKANINYEVTSEADWIKYEPSNTKALSATTFTLKVDKNETYDQRVGTVKVKGGGLEGIITITQAENLGLFVSPTEVQISKDAQEVEVEVQANVEYDIIVPEEAKGMITTIKTEGGETKALVAKKVRFGISENQKYEGREATVTLKQKGGSLCGTVKIEQAQTDYFNVTKDKYDVTYQGGEINIEIQANIAYKLIIAEPDKEWLNIIDTKSISVDNLIISVSPNDFLSRNGTIYVQTDDDILLTTIAVSQNQAPQPNNEIWYISNNNEVVNPYNESVFGSAIVSNSYDNKKGRIVLANDCSSVGAYAFYQNANIETVSIPSKVTAIGDCAFWNCQSLKSVSFSDNKNITFGVKVFYGCNNMTRIKIPEGCISIAKEMFAMCGNLLDVELPDGLISIESEAFNFCSSLKKITLPESITEIGELSFGRCYSLESLTVPNNVISIGQSAFYQCKNLSSIQLGSKLTYLGSSAFFDCESLQSIIFPKGLSVIPTNVCHYCYSLEFVSMGNEALSIEEQAFRECKKLSSVTLGNSISSIKNEAFSGCAVLSSITIPQSVQSIGSKAFFMCSSLDNFYCKPTTPPSIISDAFSGVNESFSIFVPIGTETIYMASKGWSGYSDKITGYQF